MRHVNFLTLYKEFSRYLCICPRAVSCLNWLRIPAMVLTPHQHVATLSRRCETSHFERTPMERQNGHSMICAGRFLRSSFKPPSHSCPNEVRLLPSLSLIADDSFDRDDDSDAYSVAYDKGKAGARHQSVTESERLCAGERCGMSKMAHRMQGSYSTCIKRKTSPRP